jgi:bla regulator protein blaR1
MNAVANWFTLYLINSAWQLPVLAACTAGILKAVERAGTKLQYRLWAGCLVSCIVLPTLPAMGPLPHFARHRSGLTSVTKQNETRQAIEANDPITIYAAKITLAAGKERVGKFLLRLYALSLLVGTIKLLYKLKLTREVVKGASPISLPSSAAGSLLRSAKALGIASIQVYTSPNVRCPAAVSWPKPMLIVPADFSSVPENDADAAISHELAHIRRRDFEVNLAYEVLSLSPSITLRCTGSKGALRSSASSCVMRWRQMQRPAELPTQNRF